MYAYLDSGCWSWRRWNAGRHCFAQISAENETEKMIQNDLVKFVDVSCFSMVLDQMNNLKLIFSWSAASRGKRKAEREKKRVNVVSFLCHKYFIACEIWVDVKLLWFLLALSRGLEWARSGRWKMYSTWILILFIRIINNARWQGINRERKRGESQLIHVASGTAGSWVEHYETIKKYLSHRSSGRKAQKLCT